MLPAANATARQRGRGSGGGARRLAAAAVLLVALLALCLARADAVASRSLASRAPASEEAYKGVTSASLENARAREVERGHYTTLAATAAAADEEEAVPERVELEVIQDYTPSGPNNRHQPRYP